ncbi:MAG: hypothetical protein H0U76_16120 [Ktedonobacteraceae bacterium]|nr:hypothetical protein [Ktedonobacteraceae bacterium]
MKSMITEQESIIERLTLPVTERQLERYRRAANELHIRKLTKLHDMTRAKLDMLLDEVEEYLAKSS